MKKTTRALLTLSTTAAAIALTGCASAAQPAATPAQSPVVTTAAPQAGDALTAAQSSTTPGSSPARPAAVSDPGARLDVDDQSGDGRSVVVREARITVGPGWLVVLTDDDGTLLGSAPLQPGQATPITVSLTQPVPADDDDLTAVLHVDDGDGVFDPLRDPRILDDDDDDDDDRDDIKDDDFDYRVS